MAEDAIERRANEALLDARIIAALETAPRVAVPAGFAARVARHLPPRPAVALTPRRYGVMAAVACLVPLLALMLAFAHGTAANSLYSLVIDSILSFEFAGLTVWFVARNAGYTLPGRYH